MCKVLEIARSSYYKRINRKMTAAELENHQLVNLILDYDERFGHILGYRRMTQWINTLNHFNYNHKRIYRLMRLLNIKAKIRVKPKHHKKVTPQVTAENLIARDFSASKPNEKWLTDVTEFRIKGTTRKLYLSAIINLYDSSIVAYKVSPRNNNELVFQTFEDAFKANPEARPIVHSDRGFQYTNSMFKHKLSQQGMLQSMSRTGHCIDNGPIEGFWGIIKSEMYYLNSYETYNALKQAIDQYIHFYNHVRLQKRLQNQAPLIVRTQALSSNQPMVYPIPINKKIQAYWASIKSKQSIQIQA